MRVLKKIVTAMHLPKEELVVLSVQNLANGEELLEKCLAGRCGPLLFGPRDHDPRRLSQPSQREESCEVALCLFPCPVVLTLNFT